MQTPKRVVMRAEAAETTSPPFAKYCARSRGVRDAAVDALGTLERA